jgi:hypothetical protein
MAIAAVQAKTFRLPSIPQHKEPPKDQGKIVEDKLRLYAARLGTAHLKPIALRELAQMNKFIVEWKKKGKAELEEKVWTRVSDVMRKIHPLVAIRLGPLQKIPPPKPASCPQVKPVVNRAQKLWEKLEGSAANGLIKKVEKALKEIPNQPPITIRIVSGDAVPFGGHYIFAESTIEIGVDLSESGQLANLVFELCNALHTKEYLEVVAKAKRGDYKNGEEYAKDCERIELESVKLYTAIILRCIEKDGWEPRLDEFSQLLKMEWTTFDKFWRFQLETGHVDYYRNIYDKMRAELCPVPLQPKP